MVSGFGKDERITNQMERNAFVFVPVFNPDGYEYSHTTDRLWRKTRTNFTSSECLGADPNRNWNVSWEGQLTKSLSH